MTTTKEQVRILHITLTRAERDRLNGPGGGWDSEPKFSRYADITCGHGDHWIATIREAIFAGDYTTVGAVLVDPGTDTSMCEEAYLLTQSISAPWPSNPDTFPVNPICRSTSVGDVMLLPNGRLMAVAPIAFAPVFGD